MTSKSRKICRKILYIGTLRPHSGQLHLAGLLSQCIKQANWELKVIDCRSFDLSTAKDELAQGLDGAIVTAPTDERAIALLARRGLSLVFANVNPRLTVGNRRISYLWTDNGSIGELGARYLITHGCFASFGFAQIDTYHEFDQGFWAKERCRAFHEYLQRNGFACTVCTDDEDLEDWIRKLSKPAAVMAACDTVAAKIIRVSKRLGINVPRQIAVLGVDNDHFTCTNVSPTLSSVKIDFFRMGQMEGRELGALMGNSHRSGKAEIMIPASGIAVRKSTVVPQKTADLVPRAQRFIARFAKTGIAVPDVISELGCSRRLAELRFRQVLNRSIREEIERTRLADAQKILRTKRLPLKTVAEMCGFASAVQLSRTRKRIQQSEGV